MNGIQLFDPSQRLEFGDLKVYYSNCRMSGRTSLLAGPFLTPQEAEATLQIVGKLATVEFPESVAATFGVVQLNAPGGGAGYYNSKLPDHLARNLATIVTLN